MSKVRDFPKFPETCKSLLAKYLSVEIFNQLKPLHTQSGYTLAQAINSGLKNPDSSIGIYAGDAESYQLFAPIFDPIIADYHGFQATDQHQGNLNPADLHAPDPDPEGEFILSTRIRVARNLAGYPLGPGLNSNQRILIEQQVAEVLAQLEAPLAGNYYSLAGLSESIREQLIADHFLFKAGDRFLEAAGLNRDWPQGRGIFHNIEKTFLVWVNEEDQLRIISMQMGGDIQAVFKRLATAIAQIEQKIAFAQSDHLGYLASCPTNLGTAMRASVHIQLPRLGQNMPTFQAIAEQHHLQIRGVHGEHSASEGGVFDLSNRRRLGVTEVDCVQDMYAGVVALIAKEKAL